MALGFIFIADIFRYSAPTDYMTSSAGDGGLSRFGFLSAISFEELACSE